LERGIASGGLGDDARPEADAQLTKHLWGRNGAAHRIKGQSSLHPPHTESAPRRQVTCARRLAASRAASTPPPAPAPGDGTPHPSPAATSRLMASISPSSMLTRGTAPPPRNQSSTI